MALLATGRKACFTFTSKACDAARDTPVVPMNISNAGAYYDADFLWEDIATESRRALQEQVTPSWTHESADQYRLLHLVFSEPGLNEHCTGSQAQKNR
jgi:hypothetical protein